MPYRTSSPPPKEHEPFCDRYPRLCGIPKQVAFCTTGAVALSAAIGLLWAVGWVIRAVGMIDPTDTAPNILAGLVGSITLLVVGVVGFLTYMLGKYIVCKLTGERFSP
jgi:hypothetical protein